MINVLQLGGPAGLYGAERWILALVKHHNSAKVKSIVGVIKDEADLKAPLCQEASKLGFQTVIFDAYGKASFSAVTQLRQYIIQNKINILHTHWYKTDIIGFLATRGTDCKIISTPHGWTKNPDFKLFIYEALDRCIFSFLDAVVPLSKELYSALGKNLFLKKRLHLIENSVDLTEIKSSNQIAPELLQWKEKGYFIIGYIGRLIKGKGLETLIKATAQLKKIKLKLAFIGEGEQKAKLIKLAQKYDMSVNITFFGFKANRLDYLRGFDLFILPSLSEGIPRCLMEAMGAGIPVVASDIPGCRVLVDHGNTGFLFPVENDLALANQLNYLFFHKHEMKLSADNAAKLIKEKYSAERMAFEYLHLYNQLLNTH